MRIFMEPGDSILCEEYTYPHVPESLIIPMGYKSVGIKIDERGIIPDRLLETLEKLHGSGNKMPKLLYTIPTGQNPTGTPPSLPLLIDQLQFAPSFYSPTA
jgi:DNA-binding transcriptional MocR family regulator